MMILGMKYKDKITGFTGIATGHCEYISGCNQTLLAPAVSEAGDFKEGRWFDDQRLDTVGNSVILLDNSETPGCDIAAPVR